MLQFTAVVEKHYIEKKRNIRVTICESLSHCLIIGLLILGYGLSVVVFYPAQKYNSYEIRIPPSFIDKAHPGALNLNLDVVRHLSSKLLDGPLPIPPLDVFIMANRYVAAMSKGNNQLLNLILQTNLGQQFGNLLELGALHFAPFPNPETESLIHHLNSTMTTFSGIIVHKHSSESAAIQYILTHLEERALALIVIHEISPKKINYEIRQNYTTLPDTTEVLTRVSHGIDTQYQQYFLSGFLSIQDAIDEWAFKYIGAVYPTNSSSSQTNITNVTAIDCSSIPHIFAIPFPTYNYDQNPFFVSVGFLLGLAFTSKSIIVKI